MTVREKRRSVTLLLGVLTLPLWMYLAWLLTPRRELAAVIVDKTVSTGSYGTQEHNALTWVLRHQRFTTATGDFYDPARDYFGSMPLGNRRYSLRGLEHLNAGQIANLTQQSDLTYYTDTYGLYGREQTPAGTRSRLLYGGMSQQDIQFLKSMKAAHKLIVTEFNNISEPTDSVVRRAFEREFGLRWTGWFGRYFHSLRLDNPEVPTWMVQLYRRAHGGQWPFTGEGIAFVNEKEQVVILERGKHLDRRSPMLVASEYAQAHYGLPARTRYTYWFDVMKYDPRLNTALAHYELPVTSAGQQLLTAAGLPARFPAVLVHSAADYTFCYFSGDFCDNPIQPGAAHFKGVEYLGYLFYATETYSERRGFFWQVYRPMMTRILEDYYDRKGRATPNAPAIANVGVGS